METKRVYSKMTDKDLIAAVNLVKQEVNGVFKIEDIRIKLKELGVPLYNEFATSLYKMGFIQRIGATAFSGYEWTKAEPIIGHKVLEVMTMTRKRVTAAATKSRNRKKAKEQGTYVEPEPKPRNPQAIEEEITVEPVEKHTELVPVDKAINRAIKLLIGHGYRISRPVIIYEEVRVQ